MYMTDFISFETFCTDKSFFTTQFIFPLSDSIIFRDRKQR